ncbi:helix-turn-helix domain-containing protein [Mesorhizobium sp. B1-1-8]|uniref:helix-turn-helix domain-containing protein n=1 Tax=Mesorhizobium sp. B1-1-8 TaxID=2589976 RepID=UPI00112D58A5|nr:helix-turn-helix transcriptional regulator [Mesorhizobium sp. B1-1-8]UCI10555.1 helix-turn-helix domain-containing protein [Mesorhizobium sp. B1-1-8]
MRLRFIFARNLRLLRQSANLSQEQLADLAGLDRNYIGKLEREESSPTLDTVEMLALALQVEVEVLIGRSRP